MTLADKDPQVGFRAAISLLILDQDDGLPLIKAWLAAPEIWKQEEVKQQLGRIEDPKKIQRITNPSKPQQPSLEGSASSLP